MLTFVVIFQADGGDGVLSGGGAGGRIAVYYEHLRWFIGTLSTLGGAGSTGLGAAGSIYLKVSVTKQFALNTTSKSSWL